MKITNILLFMGDAAEARSVKDEPSQHPKAGPGGYIYRGFSMLTVVTLTALFGLALYFTVPSLKSVGLFGSLIAGLFLTSLASMIVERQRKMKVGEWGRDGEK
jgi:hypothetical protein